MVDRWYNSQRFLFDAYRSIILAREVDFEPSKLFIDAELHKFGDDPVEQSLANIFWHRFKTAMLAVDNHDATFDTTKLETSIKAALLKRINQELKYVKAFEEKICHDYGESPLSTECNLSSYIKKYPALLSRAGKHLDRWCNGIQIALARVTKDWTIIRRKFEFNSKVINKFHFNLGDTHEQGQSVLIFSAENHKFVYRPYTITSYSLLRQLSHLFAQKENSNGITVPSSIECEQYGYTKYVEHSVCTSKYQIESYFITVGKLLGISYIVGLGDLHYQNIVANGASISAIDCEVLFHRTSINPTWTEIKADYEIASQDAFHDLLLGTQLLPSRIKGCSQTYDLSGLGAFGPQQFSFAIDDRHEAISCSVSILINPKENVAYYEDSPVNPYDFRNYIVEGIKIISDTVSSGNVKHTVLNLIKGGNFDFRIVLRPTAFYEMIIDTIRQPLFSEDPLIAEMYIGACLGAGDKCADYVVIERERRALLSGEIPTFHGKSRNRALFNQQQKLKDNYFVRTVHQETKRRCGKISDMSYGHFSSVLASLSTIPDLDAQLKTNRCNTSKLVKRAVKDSDTLSNWGLVYKIADSILRETCILGRFPFITSLSPINKNDVAFSKCSSVLYNGIPGIAMFFCHLHRKTGDYEKFLRHILNLVEYEISCDEIAAPGAYSGYAGNLFSFWHIASCVKMSPSSVIRHGLKNLNNKIQCDQHLDVISGAAGALAVCSRLVQRNIVRGEASRVAEICIRRLKETVVIEAGTAAWPTMGNKECLTSGFAHGAAGIAWAIAEWASVTKDKALAELAKQALAFELRFYDQASASFRTSDNKSLLDAWCYGAPGIALSAHRLAELGIIEKPVWIGDVVRRIASQELCEDDCVCHGNAGVAIILHRLGYHYECKTRMLRIMRRAVERGRWGSDLPKHYSNPGLLDGRAGVGLSIMSCLRRKPINILLLSPPT